MGRMFDGFQIVIEFANCVRFKEKKRIKEAIINNGGVISYIVSRKSTHLILSGCDQLGTYKCRSAQQLGIPIASLTWIQKCLNKRQLEDIVPFLLEKPLTSQEFAKGKIAVVSKKKPGLLKRHSSTINPANVMCFHGKASQCPSFSEDFEVVKWHVLKRVDKKIGVLYTVLELDVAVSSTESKSGDFGFRVSSYTSWKSNIDLGGEVDVEHRFLQTPEDAVAVYSYLHNKYTGTSHHMQNATYATYFKLGSTKFQQMQEAMLQDSEDLHRNTAAVMDVIWLEALGSLEAALAVKVTEVKLEQIEKAEGILKQIKDTLTSKKTDNQTLSDLTESFYGILPHRKEFQEDIADVKTIAKKLDLCQVLRDVISVGESTNWSLECTPIAKYRALKCGLVYMSENTQQCKDVRQLVCDSQHLPTGIDVRNVFSVSRATEHSSFTPEVENKRLLFHSSSVNNFVGILSRGLLLPKVVVGEYGGTRTDVGKLGGGIYFSDSASTTAQYSSTQKTSGTRFMLVAEVALGKVYDTHKIDETLSCPPDGYSSVHGVRATPECPSDFKDDEYTIYEVNQQRLQYLVEFTLPNDVVNEEAWSKYDSIQSSPDPTEESMDAKDTDLSDVQNVANPLDKVEAGLRGSGDSPVPLKSVHIRAKLMDLAAKVVVMQEYSNDNNSAIEAKYVFPLDDMAAVCGFEAFINGKHIVGQVKEKEQAHREYREAISKGHGAYLMDEEKPDVFTVNVGNLPPKATVLIKITYVCELVMEGEFIRFSLPGSVAPWDKDQHLAQVTQGDVDVVRVDDGEGFQTSLQMSVDMPFDINSIESPTHKPKKKKVPTATLR